MANLKNLEGQGFDMKPERINRKGRPKKVPSLDILLADVFSEKEMIAILKALQKSALKGNVRAMEVLLERIYGKVKQQTELSGSIVTTPITGIQIILDDSNTEIAAEASTSSKILD